MLYLVRHVLSDIIESTHI